MAKKTSIKSRSRRTALAVAGCALVLDACSPRESDGSVRAKVRNIGTDLAGRPTDAQRSNAQPRGTTRPTAFATDTTGAVGRLVLDPASVTGAYAASVNGGIFKTGDYTTILAESPTAPSWLATSDELPSLSIGDLAVDPTNGQRVVAGGGCVTSGSPCGTEGFFYSSSDAGRSWTTTSDPLLINQKIRAVTVRSQTILVATGGFGGPAGIAGGIFRRTSDAGVFQSRAGQGGLPASFGPVYDLVPNPLNPAGYYAVIATDGTSSGGVYRTNDDGTTWTRISDTDTTPRGLRSALDQYRVPTASGAWATHPVTNARLATAPTGELFVAIALFGQVEYVAYTTDQGASWTPLDVPSVLAGAAGAGLPVTSISRAAGSTKLLLDCGTPHLLTAGHHIRLTGVPAFGPAAEDLNGDWRIDIVSPTQVALVDRYRGLDGTGATSAANVRVDAGTWAGWEGASLGNQAHVHLALAVDPAAPTRLYLGGDANAIFVARGDTAAVRGNLPSRQWSSIVGENTASGTSPHVDVRDLLVDAAGRLLAATDGGAYLRTNPSSGSGDWYSLAGDMMSAEMLTVAIDPVSHAILGGLQDNGSPASDAPMTGTAETWTPIEAADGRGVAAVDANAVHPTTKLSLSHRYTAWQGEDDYRRYLVDSTGAVVFPPTPRAPAPAVPFVRLELRDSASMQPLRDIDDISWMETLVVNHFDPNRLLVAAHRQGIWESFDRGDSVTLIAGSPVSATSIAAGVAGNVEAMWAVGAPVPGAAREVYQRMMAGSLTRVRTFPGAQPFAVTMSPTNPRVAVVAGADGQVFATFDGGVSWSDVTGDLARTSDGFQRGSRYLRDVVYIASPRMADRIVVGAASGVVGAYMMTLTNPGVWTRVGDNLPHAPVTALDYNGETDTLVVATSGRGAWSIGGISELDRPPQAFCGDTAMADTACRAVAAASAVGNDAFESEADVVAPSRIAQHQTGGMLLTNALCVYGPEDELVSTGAECGSPDGQYDADCAHDITSCSPCRSEWN